LNEYVSNTTPPQEGRGDTESDNRKLGHEIRSVTHGLLGYLAVFTDEVKPHLDPGEAELLDRINQYAEKLSDLVMELLSTLPRRDSTGIE
jgi:hypothetical protein